MQGDTASILRLPKRYPCFISRESSVAIFLDSQGTKENDDHSPVTYMYNIWKMNTVMPKLSFLHSLCTCTCIFPSGVLLYFRMKCNDKSFFIVNLSWKHAYLIDFLLSEMFLSQCHDYTKNWSQFALFVCLFYFLFL